MIIVMMKRNRMATNLGLPDLTFLVKIFKKMQRKIMKDMIANGFTLSNK